MSPIAGYGLFAVKTIPPNYFLMEYTGKRIQKIPYNQSYVAKLGNVYVNAKHSDGNHKYVNHCCEPNSKFIKWADKNSIERLSIVSQETIRKGSEITVHYGSEFMIEKCNCFKCNPGITPVATIQTRSASKSKCTVYGNDISIDNQ